MTEAVTHPITEQQQYPEAGSDNEAALKLFDTGFEMVYQHYGLSMDTDLTIFHPTVHSQTTISFRPDIRTIIIDLPSHNVLLGCIADVTQVYCADRNPKTSESGQETSPIFRLADADGVRRLFTWLAKDVMVE